MASRRLVFVFWVCNATTQVALQLQQERIQVVRSNEIVSRIPTESNGTPAIELSLFSEVVYVYVGNGIRNWNDYYYYHYYCY